MRRGILIGLWIAVAAALVGVTALWVLSRNQGGIAGGDRLGADFTLVDEQGAPVTEEIFEGHPSAVFFGFTHCPDVCPTTLADMASWREALGDKADDLALVFVTVDPERDTPEVMADYVSAFDAGIRGITGEPDKVRAMLDDYHVFYRKVETEGGDYTMDHTASVFLLDGDGRLAGTINFNEDRDAALAKLNRLLDGAA
ncbi:SCO family protein [Afifella aestuarii]|uniref:SCO family protein n=1 Tax=Afifella aestuarii TaxID=1909496 RepID=UPI000FE40493|nr:SCO family protein [Afifella aestuarii]